MLGKDYELLIARGDYDQEPAVIEPVVWTTSRKGNPGKLEFTVIKDDLLGFNEGAEVGFKYKGEKIFKGYVFQKQRDKNQHIKVVAYDQLRYFKYKNAYVFDSIKASDLLKRICNDFMLKTGTIEDTVHIEPAVFFENNTLFDMVQELLDYTVMNTGKLYCLYDDFGEINLRNIENMKLDLLINKDNAENFDYASSIENTYNRVKIQAADSEQKALGQYVVSEDITNIRKWGVLQYFDNWGQDMNEAQMKAKTEALLRLYNQVQRSLSVTGCEGDVRVRAGTGVMFDNSILGDLPSGVKYKIVEEARHTFENGRHTMDLTLMGSEEFYG